MAQRGSDKHGPLQDDAMHREVSSFEKGAPTSSRVEEFRDAEAPADGEPIPDATPVVGDAERRADVARSLDRVIFPATRDSLVENAVENHAPTEVVEALARLPGDRVFENVAQIWEALGGESEHRRR